MKNTAAIHEGFMNGSRMILPRVGGGVGGGGRWGDVSHPCASSHQGAARSRRHPGLLGMDGSLRSLSAVVS